MHVFEILEEVAAEASPIAASLCDWLDHASLADGGLPFALPFDDGPGRHRCGRPRTARSRRSDHLRGVRGRPRIAHRNPAIAEHRWLTAPPSTASARSRR